MSATRYHPHVVVNVRTPNQSIRSGVPVNLIVVHSTESSNLPQSDRDLAGVADYLCKSSVQASSHVITDADGNSARLVADHAKAWHCMGYNSASLGIEQIGRAAQTSWARDEIRETARWCARWSVMHGIPLQRGAVSGGRVTRPGILRHMDLGVIGGGHHDPGSAYPLLSLIHLARFYRAYLLAH